MDYLVAGGTWAWQIIESWDLSWQDIRPVLFVIGGVGIFLSVVKFTYEVFLAELKKQEDKQRGRRITQSMDEESPL